MEFTARVVHGHPALQRLGSAVARSRNPALIALQITSCGSDRVDDFASSDEVFSRELSHSTTCVDQAGVASLEVEAVESDPGWPHARLQAKQLFCVQINNQFIRPAPSRRETGIQKKRFHLLRRIHGIMPRLRRRIGPAGPA